jgi:uncharacterized repeat protein (TIGR04138 family)
MVSDSANVFRDLVRSLEHYPEEAFLFVREGLAFAADRIHGPESEAHRLIHQFLAKNDLDIDDLYQRYTAGKLGSPIVQAVDSLGGWSKVNRHISGRDLCWALRDLALDRWGVLARLVLDRWNIRTTLDFGRIVFGFIDFELMRKQPNDCMDDFRDVFQFGEVFDEPFRGGLPKSNLDDSGPSRS